jgi:hypothetical protein
MKKIRISVFILMTMFSLSVNAQTDKATTKRIVEAKNFIFVATAALPMNSAEMNSILSRMPGANGGGTINLSGGNYDIRIKTDSLVAHLPYYGRSFNAPTNPNESGFKFTSTKFGYELEPLKKGGWQINIKPEDTKESVRMSFTISPNGYASLNISSNNKQSIAYNGYLAEPKNP